MDLFSLLMSALSSSGGLSAAAKGAASDVLAAAKTAKGFFAIAGQYALSKELSRELGVLSYFLPWGKINLPFNAAFNKQYEIFAGKDIAARVRDIEIPKIPKPNMQNAAKFVSSSK